MVFIFIYTTGGVISESSNTPSKHVQELGPKLFEGEFFGPIFLTTHPARSAEKAIRG